jgi:hypothetical protein
MNRFTSPLGNIRVASPCSANWDEMYGSERKRFCAGCKLNVYNLSDMTRQEAENLIVSSEGRLCVRLFRRADGTILTKNCPVGWQAVKRRVSRVAAAAFSVVAGFFGGILAFNLFRDRPQSFGVKVGEMISNSRAVMGDVQESPVVYDEIMGGIPEIGQLLVEKPRKPSRRHSTRRR